MAHVGLNTESRGIGTRNVGPRTALSSTPVVTPSTLNTGLQGAWNLNEASGNAIDSSGNGLDLTLNGTIGQAAGIAGVGNSRSFSGSAGNYFSHVDTANLQFGSPQPNEWTFAIWVYISDNSIQNSIASKDGATSGHRELLAVYLSAVFRVYVFRATDDPTNANAATFGAVTNNTWHLYLAQYDRTANHLLKISIDGGAFDSFDLGVGNPQTSSTEPFIIGADLYAGSETYFGGRLQRAAKWSRVLSAAEITELYNGGLGKSCPY